jgi:hypothetical protein
MAQTIWPWLYEPACKSGSAGRITGSWPLPTTHLVVLLGCAVGSAVDVVLGQEARQLGGTGSLHLPFHVGRLQPIEDLRAARLRLLLQDTDIPSTTYADIKLLITCLQSMVILNRRIWPALLTSTWKRKTRYPNGLSPGPPCAIVLW